ncbi:MULTISPECIES: hypothetical protein [Micromonospora]|uniref:hypothetical protein n=1 Tax=Micromonospora TaxID=1873 RepID=UPI0018F74D7D|nr:MULTISPECIES: hypothetical protein [Micromonospora]
MSPKRGDRAAPPAVGTEYELRFADSAAAEWYLIDDDRRTVWLVHAGTGHPRETD